MGWETNERKIKLATGTYQVSESDQESNILLITSPFSLTTDITLLRIQPITLRIAFIWRKFLPTKNEIKIYIKRKKS